MARGGRGADREPRRPRSPRLAACRTPTTAFPAPALTLSIRSGPVPRRCCRADRSIGRGAAARSGGGPRRWSGRIGPTSTRSGRRRACRAARLLHRRAEGAADLADPRQCPRADRGRRATRADPAAGRGGGASGRGPAGGALRRDRRARAQAFLTGTGPELFAELGRPGAISGSDRGGRRLGRSGKAARHDPAARHAHHPRRRRPRALARLLRRARLDAGGRDGGRQLLPDARRGPGALRAARTLPRTRAAGRDARHRGDDAGAELRDRGRGRRRLRRGARGRGRGAEGAGEGLLGRLFRLLRRSRRACLGGRATIPFWPLARGRQPDAAARRMRIRTDRGMVADGAEDEAAIAPCWSAAFGGPGRSAGSTAQSFFMQRHHLRLVLRDGEASSGTWRCCTARCGWASELIHDHRASPTWRPTPRGAARGSPAA